MLTVGRSNGLVPETECVSPRRERTCRWDGRQEEEAGASERLGSKQFGFSHSLSSNLSQPTVWIQLEITNKPWSVQASILAVLPQPES